MLKQQTKKQISEFIQVYTLITVRNWQNLLFCTILYNMGAKSCAQRDFFIPYFGQIRSRLVKNFENPKMLISTRRMQF